MHSCCSLGQKSNHSSERHVESIHSVSFNDRFCAYFSPFSSLVGFSQNSRKYGESAKIQEISNLKNTIHSLKRIIGLSYNEIMEQEKRFIFVPFFEQDGQVFFRVDFKGKQEVFTPVQLMAILLVGLKQLAENDIGRGTSVQECVITVPAYFNEYQRRLMFEAAAIAGLTPHKLTNDSSAISLEYGFYRMGELTEDKPRNVIFVDMGHSATTVSVASFLKGKVEMKGIAYDRHLGGRNIDAALFDNYVEEFSTKYRIDINSNPKAIVRLMAACEKVKKILSSNSATDLNVECIMNDVDISKMVRREDLEGILAPMLPRLDAVLKDAIEMAKIPLDQIYSIELCGGSIRIPLIKERIKQFFGGREISTTLDFDETACKGATLQCAMLSPSFAVREFVVKELITRPIKCYYDPSEENPKDVECILFPVGSTFPSLKEITFKRSKPFSLAFCYADEPEKRNISAYHVDAAGKIKVRVRLNSHGFVQVENAHLIEESTVEEKDSEGNLTEKKVSTQKDAPLIGAFSYGPICDEKGLQLFKQKEKDMQDSDALVRRTGEEKNSVEKFIYDMRIELDGRLAGFASPDEKIKLIKLMEEIENWLYSDGEDTTYEEYHKKSKSLHSIGDPITERVSFTHQLDNSVSLFTSLCQEIEAKLKSPDCSHLSQEEKEQVSKIITDKKDQVMKSMERQKAILPWNKPVLTAADVNCIKAEVISQTQPIISKPKPVPEEQANGKKDAQQEVEMQSDEEMASPSTGDHDSSGEEEEEGIQMSP